MVSSITLRIITPEAIVLDTTVSSVQFPALDGAMGILPGHAPMVAALGSGELTYEKDGKREVMFVSSGFAEVRANTVRIVSDASEPPTTIDVERAKLAAQRAKERLKARRIEEGTTEFDVLRAESALRRALMRVFVAGRARR